MSRIEVKAEVAGARFKTSLMTQVRRCRWDPESGPVRAFIFLAPTLVGPTNRGPIEKRWGKEAARIFGTPRQSNLPGVLAITGSQA